MSQGQKTAPHRCLRKQSQRLAYSRRERVGIVSFCFAFFRRWQSSLRYALFAEEMRVAVLVVVVIHVLFSETLKKLFVGRFGPLAIFPFFVSQDSAQKCDQNPVVM